MQQPDEHVQDRAGWQEQWAENHFIYGPCAGANSIAAGGPLDHSAAPVMDCLLRQYQAETKRALDARQALADAKAAALRAKPRP
jgi:hypothetical protein